MSYHAGIGEGLRVFGWGPCAPHVRCDATGCTETFEAKPGRGGGPPAWLRDRKAPPGWRMTLTDGRRRDYCPAHKGSP